MSARLVAFACWIEAVQTIGGVLALQNGEPRAGAVVLAWSAACAAGLWLVWRLRPDWFEGVR